MRELTILVDMDDTIEDLLGTWIEGLNREYGLSVTKDSIKDWDMQKAFPSLENEQIYKHFSEEEFWKSIKPYPDAVEYLRRLVVDGHKVYIVTATSYKTIGFKVEHILHKHFPFIKNENIITAHRKQMIRGDVMIDDYQKNLIGGVYQGVLITQPYNESFKNELYGIKRVSSWREIYDLISEIANEEIEY